LFTQVLPKYTKVKSHQNPSTGGGGGGGTGDAMGVGYDSDRDAAEECPLADHHLRLVAKQELREDDVIRAHALRAMRNWIRKHPDIVSCRTGT